MDDLTKAHVKGHVRGSVYVRPYDRGEGPHHSEPHDHPHANDEGDAVVIKRPTHASAPSTWDNADAVATFVPGGDVPRELNGVAIRRWKDHPKTMDGWNYADGINSHLVEPPIKPVPGKSIGAGVIIEEKDGRVWVTHPTNEFGGYKATFPKGTAEPGLSLQANAIKETFEETGLKIEITGFIGDYARITSVARMYRARRVGGDPTAMGWESQAVSLVPKGDLYEHLNGWSDHPLAEAIGAGPAPKKPPQAAK